MKSVLVRRLQMIFRQKGIPVTHDTIRDIIGHKTKGALAHYVTLTGDMDEGLELVKEALRVTHNHPLESHTKKDRVTHKRPREGA